MRKSLTLLLLVVALCCSATATTTAWGQETSSQPEPADLSFALEEWNREINGIDARIDDQALDQKDINAVEQRLQAIVTEIRKLSGLADKRLAPLRKQLSALGPAPEEGQPPESEDLAAQRAQLNEKIALISGRVQQGEALVARAEELLHRLTRVSRERVAQELLERGPSPLNPKIWDDAIREAVAMALDLAGRPARWWSEARPSKVGWMPWVWSLLAALAAALISTLPRRWLLSHWGRDPTVSEPSYSRAVLAAVVEGLTGSLVPALAVVAFVAVLDRTGLANETIEPLVQGIAVSVIFLVLVGRLARAALSPDLPAWGIVPLSREGRRRAGHIIGILTLWVALALGFEVATWPFSPNSPELIAILALLVNGVTVVLLSAFLGSWFWRQAAGPEPAGTAAPIVGRLQWLRALLALALVATPIAAVAGYANLSYRIAAFLVFSGIVVGGAFLARAMLGELLSFLFGTQTRKGLFSRHLGLSGSGAERLRFWLTLILDGILAVAVALVLVNIAGVPRSAISIYLHDFMRGFEIGGVAISPGAILTALIIFFLTLLVVRFLRRVLDERFLPRLKIDSGVRHSISAAASYTGFALAVIVGIAALGLDLSNLAIIAGALSVGIGFGLQNVVNNFVSGVLLLIERPVKVGDWIVVGSYEGTVKRISVRSTDIETFDRAEVIVPNSELISSPVVNWTHTTRLARAVLPVGVAYGSDTQKVHDLLLQVAQEHDDVVDYPAPYVLFRNFGDSALEFELRCYVRDTDYFLKVKSDLNFTIDQRFREAGVEIPFPQRDLHIKDLERISRLLSREEQDQASPGMDARRHAESRRSAGPLSREGSGEPDLDGDNE